MIILSAKLTGTGPGSIRSSGNGDRKMQAEKISEGFTEEMGPDLRLQG